LRIMASYFILISLSGMIAAILNNFKKFAVPASTSIFFNIAVIASALLLSRRYGIYALALGVLAGGLLQLLVVLPSFFAIVREYRFRIDWHDPALRKIFLLMGPMLFGIVAREINTFIDQLFASYLDAGGVTALENATRLYLMPVGVFGISLATVVFPTMSRAIARKDSHTTERTLVKGLNILLFLIIPSMAVLTVFARPVIRLVFSYGKFGEEAVTVTSGALRYYALGLFFYTGVHLMTRAFYGMKDSRIPVTLSVITIAVNIGLNFLLIGPMRYKGLALATAVASGVNFTLLVAIFRRKYLRFPLRGSLLFLGKVLLTTAAALSAGWYIKHTVAKLMVFGLVYTALWARALITKKTEVF